MANKLKEKAARGEPIIGTVSHLGSGTVIECLALAGLDFAVIDTEHGMFSYQDTLNYVRAAEAMGIVPVVRVPDYTRPSLHRMINLGAKGIIVPCIETVEEIRLLVEQAKYYPQGRHCFPYSRNSQWSQRSAGRLTEFFAEANDEVLIIPQCETVGCLNHIEEIVAIDGIDGIFFGPYDLSTDMGIPGQFEHPDFLKARSRILDACKNAGKLAVVFSPSLEAAKKNLSDGFGGTALCMDTVVFTNAFKAMTSELRDYLDTK